MLLFRAREGWQLAEMANPRSADQLHSITTAQEVLIGAVGARMRERGRVFRFGKILPETTGLPDEMRTSPSLCDNASDNHGSDVICI